MTGIRKFRTSFRIILLSLCLMSFWGADFSLAITINWDPSERADHYVVYWGTQSRSQTGTYEFESGPVADTAYTLQDINLLDQTFLR